MSQHVAQHVAQHVVVLTTLFFPRGPLSTTKSWLNFDKYFTKVPLNQLFIIVWFQYVKLFIEVLLNKTIPPPPQKKKISQKLHPHLLAENGVYFAPFL